MLIWDKSQVMCRCNNANQGCALIRTVPSWVTTTQCVYHTSIVDDTVM